MQQKLFKLSWLQCLQRKTYSSIRMDKRNKLGMLKLETHNTNHFALSSSLVQRLVDSVKMLDDDSDITTILLYGEERSFAVGADIKEMSEMSINECYKSNFLSQLDSFRTIKKPIISFVRGYALGGGCELAMLCDIIYASKNAIFGQPEIKLGTIPGAGGTQNFARNIGKYKSMHYILTGEQIKVQEAEKLGLVSKIIEGENPSTSLDNAVEECSKISEMSVSSLQICKKAINSAFETTLNEGMNYERALFFSSFAFKDKEEGMKAFLEKRKPVFKGWG